MDNSTLHDDKQQRQHVTVVADSAYDHEGLKSKSASSGSSSASSSSPLHQLNLGPAVNALMQTARERVTVASIRTLFSCIGVGESDPFNMPPQNQIVARLKTNAHYFFTNYLLATAVVFFFLLLFFHRIQLLVCIIVACGWYLVLTKKTSELDHVVAFGKRIGEQEVLLFTTAFTILFLIFFILPTIIFSLSTTFVGSALHAFFRNNRLKDDSFSSFPHKVATASAADDASVDMV